MYSRKNFLLLCLFTFGLIIVGCGASNLSDEEFAEAARETCQTLEAEINSLNQLDYSGRADAYEKAALALAEFEISEESAPNGIRLRKALTEEAKATQNYANALNEAVESMDLVLQELFIFYTDKGLVMASETGSIFDAVPLDIDKNLVIEMNSGLTNLHEAANSLSLIECAPENRGN